MARNAATEELRSSQSTVASSTVKPSPSDYPQWIGQKFDVDGKVLPFSGDTIISHLSPNAALYRGLLDFYDEVQKQSWANFFVLLPPSSWHMTVCEGVCDQIRRANSWPREVPLDASLQDCNAFVRQKLENFDLDCEPPFRMSFQAWEPLEDGIALKVVPVDTDEEQRLRKLRDRLADHLHMHHQGHESYSFHISIAYSLRYMGQEQMDVIMRFLEKEGAKLPSSFELGAPDFCLFQDMFAFQGEFYLS